LPAGGSILTSFAFFLCVCRIAKVLEVELYILTYLFSIRNFDCSTYRLHQIERFHASTVILTHLGFAGIVPIND